MSHGTVLNVGAGGDTILDVDLAGFTAYPSTGKLPATCLYVSATAGAAPTPVTASNPVPVGVQGPVAVTGTFWQATQPVSGSVGGYAATPSAGFTRPADTTAYAVGDLVANSTTTGSVVPLSWVATRVAAGSGMVRRARLRKSGTVVTAASFRLHLYGSDPSASTGVSNGDNGAWLTKQAGYLGSFDLDVSGVNGRVFSDGAGVTGVPAAGSDVTFALASGQTVYGLLEARAAYTPASAEVFTVELEILQN